MNPIFESISGRNSLYELLLHCKYLSFVGVVYMYETDMTILDSTKLGYIMGLNHRARSKAILGRPVPPALWPTILQNAPKAFKKVYDGFIGIEKHPDAVYHLLREQAAEEIIFRSERNKNISIDYRKRKRNI